jgi:hypothetical protein
MLTQYRGDEEEDDMRVVGLYPQSSPSVAAFI